MKAQLKALYLFVNEEGLEIILTKQMLKASVTASVNDPMENLPAFTQSVHPAKAFSVQQGGKPYFCFSESMSNPQMWGQYAQEGRGACLVFLFPLKRTPNRYSKRSNAPLAWTWDLSDTERGKLPEDEEMNYWQALDYRKNRVSIKGKHDRTECIFCKGADWSYEKEVRCCCNQLKADEASNNNLLYQWPLQFLAGVILGPRSKYTIAYLQKKLTPPSKGSPDNHILGKWLRDREIIKWVLASETHFHWSKYEYYSAPWFNAMEGYEAYPAIAIAKKLGILRIDEEDLNIASRSPEKSYSWPEWALKLQEAAKTLVPPPDERDAYKDWITDTYKQVRGLLENPPVPPKDSLAEDELT